MMVPCACGCGELISRTDKHGNPRKYVLGHSMRGVTGKNHPNFGKHHSEETKLKMSESLRGENHPNWQGGISDDKYCYKFNEQYKEAIRNHYGRVCFLCGKTEVDNGNKLSVHHADYDKMCGCNDNMCRCVPLCVICHAKTNGNRTKWENEILLKLDPNLTLDVIMNFKPLTEFFR